MNGIFRAEFFCTGESPLGLPRGMRAKSGRVARLAHVAEKEFAVRITEMKFRFETVIVEVPLGQPIPYQNDPFSGQRWHDLLGSFHRGRSRNRHQCMGRIVRSLIHPIPSWSGDDWSRSFWSPGRDPGGRTLAGHVVIRLEIARFVIVFLVDRRKRGRLKTIDRTDICFVRHLHSREVQGSIDDEPAKVLIGEVSGRTHGSAKGAALFNSIR